MIPSQDPIKEFLLYFENLDGPAQLELELQIQEQFQLAKKTRWWYRRQLRASLGIPRVIRRRRCRLTLEECKRRIAAMEVAARGENT